MKRITWRIHLKSSPEDVYQFLTTTSGRQKFWAENAAEKDGMICFVFPNGEQYQSQILQTR